MKSSLEYIGWFVGLILLQVLLLNNIQIAGVINPFVYIYMILALPTHTNRISLILIGFVMGLILDMFSNTWGIHAMAATLIAYLRPYVLQLVASQEDLEKVTPRWKLMHGNYIKYIMLMTLIHHLVLFMLEAFSFEYFWIVIAKTVVSSFITIILILAIEKIRN